MQLFGKHCYGNLKLDFKEVLTFWAFRMFRDPVELSIKYKPMLCKALMLEHNIFSDFCRQKVLM